MRLCTSVHIPARRADDLAFSGRIIDHVCHCALLCGLLCIVGRPGTEQDLHILTRLLALRRLRGLHGSPFYRSSGSEPGRRGGCLSGRMRRCTVAAAGNATSLRNGMFRGARGRCGCCATRKDLSHMRACARTVSTIDVSIETFAYIPSLRIVDVPIDGELGLSVRRSWVLSISKKIPIRCLDGGTTFISCVPA